MTELLPSPAVFSVTHRRIDRSDGRVYEHTLSNGRNVALPSVTTVLGMVGKPYLTPWAVKVTIEGIQEALASGKGISDALAIGRGQHKQISADACQFGTAWHSMIEAHIGGHADPFQEAFQAEAVTRCFDVWRAWWDRQGWTPVQIEFSLYSLRYGFAGTADLIARDRDGRLLIGDWKSSNSLSPEYLVQLAAYAAAYQEMTGQEIDRVQVVRVGKKDGRFETAIADRPDLQGLFRVFQAAKKIWDWKQQQGGA